MELHIHKRAKLQGQLRQLANRESEECELNHASSLEEALADRTKSYGADFQRILFDDQGRLRPSVMITVNGAAIDKDEPPQLKDGDEIAMLPAIAGG